MFLQLIPTLAATRRLFLRTAVAGLRPYLLLFGLLGLAASPARAVIPAAAVNDPLYAKGYVVVTHYAGVHNDGTNADTTTAGINEALMDVYNYQNHPPTQIEGGGTLNGSLVLYFPPGTYLVNDRLKAWTANGLGGNSFATPKNHIVVIGATTGPQRPLIKLADGSAGYGNAAVPKTVLDFRNFTVATFDEPVEADKVEIAGQGYYQTLRGIDIDCGAGNPGAIGLYFNIAQNSTAENVKVTATNAYAGIRSLPSPSMCSVNLEVEGGQYGLDFRGTGPGTPTSGNTVAGVILRNQTVSAIAHDSFAPITLVGFEIVTLPGSTQAAITTLAGSRLNNSGISLIDGKIILGGEPAVAAINNGIGKSFYARNVYISGGNKLFKSGGLPAVTATGGWKLVGEYSYCDQSAPDVDGKTAWTIIDGIVTRTPAPLGDGQVVAITSDVAAPPADLLSRHVWGSLPAVEDADAVDAFTLGIVPGNVSSEAFQVVIDAHRKIFLRKGIYALDGTITLHKNTILYGVSRSLTRIETQSTWDPTSETAVITTDDDPAATTYLGDLSIGVDTVNLAHDWFTALDWQAGRNSMVHMGTVYREPVLNNRFETNPHSLIRIRNSGGGRWYSTGAIKSFTSNHPDYRILKVEGTTEPLWLYGVNPEHPSGCDTYVEFVNARNIRVYNMKSEFSDTASFADKSVVVTYRDVVNVAQFGHAALRNAVTNHGCIEFLGASTDRVLATLIAPQLGFTTVGDTVRENLGGGNVGVSHPNVVALYKRGVITAADEVAMNHAEIFYGPSTGNVPPSVIITSPVTGEQLTPVPTVVAATAFDADGTVARVDFFADGVLIGSDLTAPYSISWTPGVAGSHALTAAATDDLGALNTSPAVNVTVFTAVPPAPADLTGTAGNAQVSLSWAAVEGAAGYVVKRSPVAGGPYAAIATPATPAYLDTGLTNGATYYYVVSAVNPLGESAHSLEAAFVPQAPSVIEALFTSIGAEDGWVLESTQTSGVGGSIAATGNSIQALRVGDDVAAKQYKTILSFDTSTLPAGATLLGASLELRRGGIAGSAASVMALGALQVEIRTGTFGAGVLENADFQAAATAANVATLNYPAANNDWSTGLLNATGLQALNRAGRTQFRITFATPDNGNTAADLLGFFSGETADAASRPVLRVSYSLPPVITLQPVAQTITAGDNATFTVSANGSGPLTYQWRRGGVSLTGNPTATNASLLLSGAMAVDAGSYDCVVTNLVGTATSAAAQLTVEKAPAVVTLTALNQTYTGAPLPAGYTTTPAGLAATLTYDGGASAPANAGSYAVTATIDDANYTGTASGTLVIARAPAAITLGNLEQVYDGAPKSVSVATVPAGLTVTLTYDGAAAAPTAAGSHTVVATVVAANYTGTASATLVITKAGVPVTLAPLTQLYDGTPRVVTATTVPAGLTVTVTYDGNTTAPTGPGSYVVVATVNDGNYSGTKTDTLVVGTAVTIRHAPAFNGGLDGSVQVLLPENVTLNSNAWISGDLLMPGTPSVQLNGQPTYLGTLDGTGSATPTSHRLTLNGNSVLGHLVRRTDAVTLPVVAAPPAPAGTRNVSLNRPGDPIGDFATLRNLTLNGSVPAVVVPAGTYGTLTANGANTFILGVAGAEQPAVYNLQGLTLNGTALLQLDGPVVITLANGMSFSSIAGDEDHPEWLQLRVAAGGLTLNSNAEFHGSVLAPAGTVTINGNATLRGQVTADRLTINSNGLLDPLQPAPGL